MFGTYPVLFFALRQLLTKEEEEELINLQAKSPLTQEELVKMEALEAKASIKQGLSMMVPFVIDGELLPMQVTDSSMQMTKTVTLLADGYEITPSANISTINIVSAADGFTSTVIDLVFMLADTVYQRQIDKAPSVAFFGDQIAIPYGYLIGIALSNVNDSNVQMISLTIARDLTGNKAVKGEAVAEVEEETGTFYG